MKELSALSAKTVMLFTDLGLPRLSEIRDYGPGRGWGELGDERGMCKLRKTVIPAGPGGWGLWRKTAHQGLCIMVWPMDSSSSRSSSSCQFDMVFPKLWFSYNLQLSVEFLNSYNLSLVITNIYWGLGVPGAFLSALHMTNSLMLTSTLWRSYY